MIHLRLNPIATALLVYEGVIDFHPLTGALRGVTTRGDFARIVSFDIAMGFETSMTDIAVCAGVQFDLSSIAIDVAGAL